MNIDRVFIANVVLVSRKKYIGIDECVNYFTSIGTKLVYEKSNELYIDLLNGMKIKNTYEKKLEEYYINPNVDLRPLNKYIKFDKKNMSKKRILKRIVEECKIQEKDKE